MGRGYLLGAVAAVALSLVSGPATAKTLDLIVKDSEPAEGRAKVEASKLAELAKGVDADPKNRQARFEHVRALMQNGKLEEALAAAKAWREKDAYNLVVVRLLGDIYTELGQTENATRTYSAVVELLPEDASAQRALASVLKQGGDVQGAYDRLKAAALIRPDDARLSFELADAAHRLGRLGEAEELFKAVVENDKTPTATRYPAKQRLAQVYGERRRAALKTGKKDQAAALMAQIDALDIKGGAINDIKVFLTWDTDRSDVDLWVTNPAGEKIFYSHKQGKFGGALFGDVTTGYGPESFTAKTAQPGTYKITVNYYSAGRSAFPEARGEVVVVLNEGRPDEKKTVLPYRLFKAKQTVTVAHVQVKK
jgi:tetratricopeptide (TPR) repeat protein